MLKRLTFTFDDAVQAADFRGRMAAEGQQATLLTPPYDFGFTDVNIDIDETHPTVYAVGLAVAVLKKMEQKGKQGDRDF